MSIARTTPAQNPRGAHSTTRNGGLVGTEVQCLRHWDASLSMFASARAGVKGVGRAHGVKFSIEGTRACRASLGASRITDSDARAMHEDVDQPPGAGIAFR